MKSLVYKVFVIFLNIAFIFCCFSGYGSIPEFPLKVSANGRYLVDSKNVPFFYQAETPWLIFVKLKPAEYSQLMDIRISQGFTAIQIMALPDIYANAQNINGDVPFFNDDISMPNEAYFAYLKEGIKVAEKKGLFVSMAVLWKGCCGGAWSEVILKNGSSKCLEYGKFLGRYFAECKNIMWVMGGDNDPGCHTDHYRAIASGIREVTPDALQTYHASSGHSSADVMNYLDHSWLSVSWTYTYFHKKHNVWLYLCGWGELPEVYQMNHIEYQRIPVKPYILGESQYEGEDSSAYKPLTGSAVARRQAWWSMLSGSCGHAYGSWNWSIHPDWQKVANDSGANQMKNIKAFLESIAWYNLIPAINQDVIVKGKGIYGAEDYVTVSQSPDKKMFVAYFPPTGKVKRPVSIPLGKNKIKLIRWYNPVNGNYSNGTGMVISNDVALLETPGDNGSGYNDWVLITNFK